MPHSQPDSELKGAGRELFILVPDLSSELTAFIKLLRTGDGLFPNTVNNGERPLWVVISTGRRNTCLKPHCLVFRPESFAGVPEGLAAQTLPMIERKAQIVGCR